MARKSKEEEKKEKTTKFTAIISIVLSITLLIVSMTKSGAIGQISYNLLSFVFGRLYVVLLFTSIITSIANLLKHKYSTMFIIGVVLLNISVILLGGYIFGKDVATLDGFKSFFKDNFLLVFKNEDQNFGAGLVGLGLYALCAYGIGAKLTLLFTIVGIIASIAFMVPGQWYKDVIVETKEQRRIRKEEKQKEKEERRKQEEEEEALRLAQEEEEKLRLAEEINNANEEYEEDDDEEEIVIEEDDEEPLDMSSKSDFFLNFGNYRKSSKPIETNNDDIDILTDDKKQTKAIHNVVKKIGSSYRFPPLSVLDPKQTAKLSSINKTNAQEKGKKLLEILETFEINAKLVNTYIGPSVTKFEIKPDSTIKVSKVMSIQDNLKMELAAKDIRIEAPIPGKSAVGVEIPNAEMMPVKMAELVPGIDKNDSNMKFALGKNLLGENIYCDIRKMPHMLIAGATGSGKSVCENAIITSILLRSHPDNVKLVLIDPKKVEFAPYHDIPHLLWPVITDTKMAILMLEKLVVIMEQRYEKFAQTGAKNLDTYNDLVERHNEELKEDEVPWDKMPYIVVIIDELADLMATSKNEVIGSIQRITQLARASGIHLIVATQRPSTDIINGVIKNNIPSRVAFSMPTAIDSRTIIDQVGAERLLGNGDMLYAPQSEPAPIRIQGVYVSDNEIQKITEFTKKQGSPNYDDTYYTILNNGSGSDNGPGIMNSKEVDPLYDQIIEFVKESQKASTSLLQRRFGIGFNRAARIIDQLEEEHIIGPSNGSKPREVLLKPDKK